MTPHRLRARRGLRDRRPPDRLRRLAPRRGRADGPRLLPLRRPAGRPDRACGDRRRSSPFVRDGRMVGRGSADDKGQLHMHLKAAEAILATRGRAAGQPQVHLRGRGGVDLRCARRLARGEPRPARGRRRRDQRHGLLRGQPAGDDDLAARDDVRPDRRHPARPSTSTPAASAAPSRTRPTRWPGSSPSSRRRRPRPRPGLLRRRRRADRRGAVRDQLPAVRRGRRSAAAPASRRSSRRAGLHAPRVHGRPPDARRQRHLGRLHRRGLEDDHPGARPRQGQLPARARPGPGQGVRGASRHSSWRSRRRASRSRSRTSGRPAGRLRIDHPAGREAAARALEATFGQAPVFIRSGGTIPVAAMFDEILGCRS